MENKLSLKYKVNKSWFKKIAFFQNMKYEAHYSVRLLILSYIETFIWFNIVLYNILKQKKNTQLLYKERMKLLLLSWCLLSSI